MLSSIPRCHPTYSTHLRAIHVVGGRTYARSNVGGHSGDNERLPRIYSNIISSILKSRRAPIRVEAQIIIIININPEIIIRTVMQTLTVRTDRAPVVEESVAAADLSAGICLKTTTTHVPIRSHSTRSSHMTHSTITNIPAHACLQVIRRGRRRLAGIDQGQ